ncbi:bacteriocin-like protein [Streptomyces sp. 846.5]|nr:bacteriocin [Streptomyces sp. 846.5]TDU03423.1 bacteriocin-like protein [Streptomyces sp. 846.5]
MRNNTESQIETHEISDSELDNISGGVASATVSLLGYGASVGIGDVVGTAKSVVATLPVSPLLSLASVQTTPSL